MATPAKELVSSPLSSGGSDGSDSTHSDLPAGFVSVTTAMASLEVTEASGIAKESEEKEAEASRDDHPDPQGDGSGRKAEEMKEPAAGDYETAPQTPLVQSAPLTVDTEEIAEPAEPTGPVHSALCDGCKVR